jgi:hypothetical protein
MARDRNRTDDWFSAPDRGRRDMDEERGPDGAEEDVRGVADEGEDFEETEDLGEEEEDEESD